MSFFKKLQERIMPTPSVETAESIFPQADTIRHEFVNFASTYRICLLTNFEEEGAQEIVLEYKNKLDRMGYECDALMYRESHAVSHAIQLPCFGLEDIDKKTSLPNSPRTDRVIVKKYDLLFNLYMTDCLPLQHISHKSYARCRVAPYIDSFTKCADVLIPCHTDRSLKALIGTINNTLQLKNYERKPI